MSFFKKRGHIAIREDTMKTVFITGSNRGIGLAFVAHYQKQGWHVISAARDPETADELKALLPGMIVRMDVSQEDSIQQAAEQLKSTPIDLLINNAGISSKGDLGTTTKSMLMNDFQVNAVGSFLVTRAFLPNLKKAAIANGGAMVAQISSQRGSIHGNATGGGYAYKASKAALNMLTKTLSMDLKKDQITVIMLHPGYVKTDMTRHKGHLEPSESVAGMAMLLAQKTIEDTGEFLDVDGSGLPW